MFCKYCGKEINDYADVCVNCGRKTERDARNSTQSDSDGVPKTGIGVLLGLFLGVIGLVIGLVLYPNGSVERKTFLKGWLIAFVISLVAGIILGVIYFSAIISLYSYYY